MDGPVEETRLLDRYLPEWDAGRVDSLWVPATPERALRAVEELSVEELPLFRWLMKARLAPARALGRHYPIELSGGFLDGFLGIGFVPLGRRPGREVAIGGVGRFWRPIRFFPLAPLADARAFDAFDEPGWTRAAFDVTVQPEGDGARITSEIRMAGTDPVSARRFRRYWRLIRVPSGWIRRSALRCVRRRLQVSG